MLCTLLNGLDSFTALNGSFQWLERLCCTVPFNGLNVDAALYNGLDAHSA